MSEKVWDYKSNENDELAKKVSKDPTIVMTKDSMAKHLINRTIFYENERVLDPCRGDGAFYNNFPSKVKKDWCEINEGRDFFDYDEKCDTIMTNPPFVPRKLFWDFVVKGSKVAQKRMFWLINMGCLNVFTPKRLQQLKNNSWYITHLHIVSDKRWYGRYVMVEMGRLEERNIMTYNLETF